MVRPVPQIAITFISKAEGFRAKAYQDSKGVWTIGYGHTGGVTRGMTITRAEAVSFLRVDADVAAGRLATVLPADVIDGLTDHQYGALISFVFNLGVNKTWTIWKVLKAGKLDAVPEQLKRFDKIRHTEGPKAGTVETLPGLTARRAAESALWATPQDDLPHDAIALAPPAIVTPPSSEIREMQTPPGVADPRSLTEQKTFATACIAGAATCATAVAEVSKAITPYADASPVVAKVVAGLATAGAVLAVATIAFVWLKNRRAAR